MLSVVPAALLPTDDRVPAVLLLASGPDLLPRSSLWTGPSGLSTGLPYWSNPIATACPDDGL